jgi:hypothetical protein
MASCKPTRAMCTTSSIVARRPITTKVCRSSGASRICAATFSRRRSVAIPSVQGLMRIRAIYAADEAVRRAPATERSALREQHVRPLMTSFFDWARSARDLTPGRNLATKALGYALNQEAELLRVLEDVNLAARQHALGASATKDRRRAQGMDVLRKRHACRGCRRDLQHHRLVPASSPRPIHVPGRDSAGPAVLAARAIS